MYEKLKQHFDTEVNHEQYYTNWTTVSFDKLRRDYSNENLHKILQRMFDKLLLCQRALGPMYAGQQPLKTAIIRACCGIPELEYALFRPADDVEKLFSELRSSLQTSLSRNPLHMTYDKNAYADSRDDAQEDQSQLYFDRRFINNNRNQFWSQNQNHFRKFPHHNLDQ